MLRLSSNLNVRAGCIRSYPVLFGKKVAKLLPCLMEHGAHRQPFRDLKADFDAPKMLLELESLDSEVEEFQLKECVSYLKSAKRLSIPAMWVQSIGL